MIQDLVRNNIRNLKPYSSAREEFTGLAKVYLDANENPFDTGYNRYPDPLQKDLKTAISKVKGIATDHIFVGNGSDEALDLLFRVFCEPKEDAIIYSSPTYGMYEVLADIQDIKKIDIPLKPDLSLDVDALLATNAKILFICSPNNPTGNQFNKASVLKLVEGFKGLVVVDEAYADFGTYSLIEEVPKHKHLVVCQTFSKAWGLAGLRAGICFASQEVISYLNKVKMPYNVNAYTQKELLKAINTPKVTKVYIEELKAEKVKLVSALKDFPQVTEIFKSDANFVLVKFNRPVGDIYQSLLTDGVLVRNQSNKLFCENSLRFTIGKPEENKALLKSLSKALSI